ncbi:MAG: hypothetical protein K0R84_1 [Clostridia bacterium]|jgi:hypothetical protein|nr:hypothetical protein [Clostridia bacterium]
MSDNYNNYGNVAAMGRNAKAVNTQFTDNHSFVFSKNHIDDLQRFIEQILSADESELSKAEKFSAAAQLYEIVESLEKEQTERQSECLSKWHKWIGNLKEPALKTLAVAADVATLGIPLLKILGLFSL